MVKLNFNRNEELSSYLNHIPDTAPSISWEHWSHDLYKTVEGNKDSILLYQLKTNRWGRIHISSFSGYLTRHREANSAPCTILPFPKYLCTKLAKTNNVKTSRFNWMIFTMQVFKEVNIVVPWVLLMNFKIIPFLCHLPCQPSGRF